MVASIANMLERLRQLAASGQQRQVLEVVRLSVDYASAARMDPKSAGKDAWATLWQLRDAIVALGDPELLAVAGLPPGHGLLMPETVIEFADTVLDSVLASQTDISIEADDLPMAEDPPPKGDNEV